MWLTDVTDRPSNWRIRGHQVFGCIPPWSTERDPNVHQIQMLWWTVWARSSRGEASIISIIKCNRSYMNQVSSLAPHTHLQIHIHADITHADRAEQLKPRLESHFGRWCWWPLGEDIRHKTSRSTVKLLLSFEWASIFLSLACKVIQRTSVQHYPIATSLINIHVGEVSSLPVVTQQEHCVLLCFSLATLRILLLNYCYMPLYACTVKRNPSWLQRNWN